MGGAATKHFNTTRIGKEDFEELLLVLEDLFLKPHKDNPSSYLLNLKNQGWNNLEHYFDNEVTLDSGKKELQAKLFYFKYLPYFKDKADFGDCDILSTLTHKEFEEIINQPKNQEKIKILGVVRNNDTNSYAIQFKKKNNEWSESFQLDHIHTTLHKFDYAYNYFSYNDLGNFIGRIAAAMNMKFGHDGLYLNYYFKHNGKKAKVHALKDGYEVEEESENDDTITVQDYSSYKKTKRIDLNFEQSIELLGFSYERFKQGFETRDEIVDYVYNSTYFHPDWFLLENRNHAQRVRDSKRPNYNYALNIFEQKREEFLYNNGAINEVTEKMFKSFLRQKFKAHLIQCYPQKPSIYLNFRKETKRNFIYKNRLKGTKIQSNLFHKYNILFYVPNKVKPETLQKNKSKYLMLDIKIFGEIMKGLNSNPMFDYKNKENIELFNLPKKEFNKILFKEVDKILVETLKNKVDEKQSKSIEKQVKRNNKLKR